MAKQRKVISSTYLQCPPSRHLVRGPGSSSTTSHWLRRKRNERSVRQERGRIDRKEETKAEMTRREGDKEGDIVKKKRKRGRKRKIGERDR